MGKVNEIPSLLNQGDNIRVVAPSGRVNVRKTERAISILKSWGLNVSKGHSLYSSEGIFAGSDNERLHDIQDALDNPDIAAIFCARGGYGLSRIIDRIDFEEFKKSPKWVVGYSDITLLHLEINRRTGIPVIHGEMLLNYSDPALSSESLTTLREALFKGTCSYQWDTVAGKQGETRAIITGGNLSLICNLLGTGISDYFNGKILFIEDTTEQLYRLDRMLMSLRLAGVFKNIVGLVVGGMTDINDSNIPFGKGIEEIILDAVSPNNIPVAFNFPAGHMDDNRSVYMGKEAFLRVDSLSAVLSY